MPARESRQIIEKNDVFAGIVDKEKSAQATRAMAKVQSIREPMRS